MFIVYCDSFLFTIIFVPSLIDFRTLCVHCFVFVFIIRVSTVHSFIRTDRFANSLEFNKSIVNGLD